MDIRPPIRCRQGCDGVRGRRQAPTLYSVAYQSHDFWDGRVQSLERHGSVSGADTRGDGQGLGWGAVLREPFMHNNGALATLAAVMRHYERLAAGEQHPLVGKLAFYVRYKTARFSADGDSAANDHDLMLAFMHALIETQRSPRPDGVQPLGLLTQRTGY
ncbi:hypothetical protein NKDENANG_01192 [Candidatus Entotheonellaceae bacterium PAL068K]